MKRPSFSFVDLFAGIGGFHLALRDLGGQCVFVSELDEIARDVYELNFGKDVAGPVVGDIVPLSDRRVSRLIPEHDVLAAGFPCQPFSKSGLQEGLADHRGVLFHNIARIIEARRPRVIVLENVRNLAGPRHRSTWTLIVKVLRDLGYRVSAQPQIVSPHLLSPKIGGTPQVRPRIFIVGVYVGKSKAWTESPTHLDSDHQLGEVWAPESWDLEKHLLEDDHEIVDFDFYRISEEKLEVIEIWEDFLQRLGRSRGSRLPGFPFWETDMSHQVSSYAGIPAWKRTLLEKNEIFFRQNASAIRAWRNRFPQISHLRPSFRKFEWQAQDLDSIWNGVIQFRPSGMRVKKATYLPSLVAMNQTSIIASRRRTITVKEAARLQGFPDNFDFGQQRPSQSFKQLGNAVAVGAAKFVLGSVLNAD